MVKKTRNTRKITKKEENIPLLMFKNHERHQLYHRKHLNPPFSQQSLLNDTVYKNDGLIWYASSSLLTLLELRHNTTDSRELTLQSR